GEFAALIGLDWASQRHALCLYDCATGKREASTLEHTPEAIGQWAQALKKRFAGKKIALCLEQSKGALINALLEYSFFVLYPINPATAACYRQAFKTSRAKADPSDAQLCLELLLRHREKLTPLLPNDAPTRELSRLLEARRTLIDLRTLLTNMLRDALKSYFPQALELAGQDLFAPLACHFLLKWPSLQELQKARRESVRNFYYAHNCRRLDRIEKRLAAISQMRSLCSDSAVVEPAIIQVKMLAAQLLGLSRALKEYDLKIEHLFALSKGATIWESFPGAGPTLAPRLACAFGSQRSRYQSASAIQQYSGVAPVTEKSGKNQHWVHRRWGRPRFVHQSFFEYALQSVLHCGWAKLYLKEQIARGKAYPTAVRALAFKWQRIMFVCWRDRLPYDETTYLQSLKRRGSHLARKLNQELPQAA
ncbi:MAG TPA: transposase, partial [Candidatus Limnocylindrales bacterium]|nr:transposase [Candidatus Limnocylindrales bacterium]